MLKVEPKQILSQNPKTDSHRIARRLEALHTTRSISDDVD